MDNVERLQVGHRLPDREFKVTRSAIVRYAGASGDFNPLHFDDAAAQSAGMQTAFAHGMFSAGCLATALTDAMGAQSLRRLAVRFRSQAWLDSTLTSHIAVTDMRRDGDCVLTDLDCRLVSETGSMVMSGAATVTNLPRPHEPEAGDGGPPTPSESELLGRRLTPAVVVVERGPAQVFAAAVHADSEVYRNAAAAAASGLAGIPIPPTYLFAVANWGTFADGQPKPEVAGASLVELIAALRNGRKGVVLHGEQAYTYHTPVWVGDVLHIDGYVERVEEKLPRDGRPGMTVMVVRTDYRGESGRKAVTARATYVFRHAAP